ncbi:acyl-CoA dehydrogenase family protein [Microbulbifer spongiae]|uniref:Acyl-CoA/acyl-ACP dehydrogenase n=1 Tax=Microbulbifer spongiae TaxID=2944933 RepID=A0ABY9EC52_9GAMM|nr:acyl-CoA dehydrogenase family protein [Microbulbifer sp. MI-G]WKD49054.1 acyl-CoA/acyl-ACP dehydrogenase [Microbulbifer sp. MI-G]
MEFSFNPEQQHIAEVADTFLGSVAGSEAMRRAMKRESGFEVDVWQKITQKMGWHLTHIPEQFNGLGLGYIELCILLERMGANLVCAPFYSTVVFGVNALLITGTKAQKRHWLEQIVTGQKRLTLAYSGQGRGWGTKSVTAQYQKKDNDFIINGNYHYVIDGHTVDALVVAAREIKSGNLGLFVLPTNTEGVTRCWTPSMDQTRKLATVKLSNVILDKDSFMGEESGDSLATLDNILALACIALAAEQMGVAEKSLNMTVSYIAQRKQFDRVIGGFQALKHKAADMLNRVESARSAVYYAACIANEFMAGNDMGAELLEAASIAKAYCCEAAYFNSGLALQMHGGVGFTWEYDVHLYFKRAKAAQVSLGDTAWHKERIADIVLGSAD